MFYPSTSRLLLVLGGVKMGALLASYTVLPVWGIVLYWFWGEMDAHLVRGDFITGVVVSLVALLIYGGIALQRMWVWGQWSLMRDNPISVLVRIVGFRSSQRSRTDALAPRSFSD
jgi:hypothetical protein